METHTYPFFPSEVSTVHIALYRNVSNSQQLRNRLVAASALAGAEGEREREAVNYAFVDARLITSRLQVQTAIYQAILTHAQGSLRTKTIHSEILWVLNPSHNISEAIKRFGVSSTSTSLLVIRVCSPLFTTRDFQVNVGQVITGNLVSMATLGEITNWSLVRKYYKLNSDPVIQSFGLLSDDDSRTQERALMDGVVVSCIATKAVST